MTEYSVVPWAEATINKEPTGPLFEVQTSATDYVVISEMGLIGRPSGTAAANSIDTLSWGIGTPATKGVGAIAGTLLGNDAGNTNSIPRFVVLTRWSIPPTSPTQFYRRQTRIFSVNIFGILSASVVVIKFDGGLKLAPSSSLVFWLISTTASFPYTFETHIVVDG